MRERYCKVCQGWHRPEAWPHNCLPERNWNRSDLPSPMLVRDQMDDLWHPSTGQYFDSKSKFRAVTKAKGGREVGNDIPVYSKPDNSKAIRTAVGEAVRKVNAGYKPSVENQSAWG